MPGLGLVAKPGCNIGYRSDRGIVESTFKANRAERGKSVCDPDAKTNIVAKLTPLLDQLSDGRSHINRHQYGLESGVIYRNWVIEHDHHPVTSIAFKGAAILVYDPANRRMVFTQQSHHVFWIRALRETGKATQVAEQRGNFSAVAFELLLGPGSDDQIGYLRRKETSQSAYALDFTHLVRDALFKLLVQFVKIIEQSRILDGDDGLRGEILNQLDLLVAKRAHFGAVDDNCPN